VKLNDYSLIRRDRIGGKGGGLCAYVSGPVSSRPNLYQPEIATVHLGMLK
jgi:hypothetical protein